MVLNSNLKLPVMPSLPTQTIMIIEGPAGSGKSTFAKWVLERNPKAIVLESDLFPRPRHYDSPTGEGLAILKDLNYFIEAIKCPIDQIPIIDRWALSSWVYSTIRRGTTPSTEELVGLVQCTVDMASMALASMILREVVPHKRLQFKWCFLVPPVEVIKKRRVQCGKFYPYAAEQESELYTMAVNFFLEQKELPDWLKDIQLIGEEGE